MSLSSRGARAAARSLIRPVQPRPARRHASHGPEHSHGTGESALHTDAGVKAGGESFGKGFYITIAVFPVTYFTYQIATAQKNPIERFVDYYALKRDVENEKNALHNRMMQQALEDRALFKDSVIDFAGPKMRYLEGLNHGSPTNVVAGQGAGNMEELMQYYAEKKREEASSNERKRMLEEK